MGYSKLAGKTAELGQLHHLRRNGSDSRETRVSTRKRSEFRLTFHHGARRSFARYGAMGSFLSQQSQLPSAYRENGRVLQSATH